MTNPFVDQEVILVEDEWIDKEESQNLPRFWAPEPGEENKGNQKPKSKKDKKRDKARQQNQVQVSRRESPPQSPPVSDPSGLAEENTIYRHVYRQWCCMSCQARADFALENLQENNRLYSFNLFCITCGHTNTDICMTPKEAFADGRIVKV